MTIDPHNLLAILAMGLATYATRVAGLFLAGRLPRTGRVRIALDALPPAVLTAVIAPALVEGPAEAVAGAVTALLAFRLPLIATVAIGVAVVAGLRAIGW
ncbi:AzlD family protein [Oharaeibacter diazotrophicus]|uniref:Putative membrane protein n=1 Tax=Oharaeibacter diazotrophicus TaxID=1920512 RepID=A0A4V3CWA3_9HYPH|nr:AzlD domain-containing protein [Oharaeibacter diazotrophicus]TDP85548.1 putative membrane protein [Oharaeibacter diazotrophicus]BBE74519.1 branched-chain amino acid transport protein AzlD [Pleomorphomonas sp. SM30]GLS75782.1 membrane protein [Oharaeibacter diazotrophicus]